jgi:hypothetical protein
VGVQLIGYILQPIGLDEAIIVGDCHKASPYAFDTSIDGSSSPALG